MGKMPLLTREQQFIIDKVKESKFLRSDFYLTGGTALSAFYLKHRYSEDLDFFSEKKLDVDLVVREVNELAKSLNFTYRHESREVVEVFLLTLPGGEKVKVDFAYYPYPRVEKGIFYEGFAVDSLLDIAINKLTSVNQRSQAKDFVDLYFLLDKFTIWDLIEGARVKFKREFDTWLLSADLSYSVEAFTYLPRMIKPLTLEALKAFFRRKAVEIAKRSVE